MDEIADIFISFPWMQPENVPSLSPVTAIITRQAPVSYFSYVAWIFSNRLALNKSCVHTRCMNSWETFSVSLVLCL
jgi:hypothetical protein